jgi:transcriptional regulator CtsR
VTGKTYNYVVKAYKKALESDVIVAQVAGISVTAGKSTAYSAKSNVKSYVYLKVATVKSVANTATGIKIIWNKVAGAKGYYIYRKLGTGGYTLLKKVTSGTTVSYVDTKAVSGKKYTYAVKPYNGSSVGTYKTVKACVRLTQPKLKITNTDTAKKSKYGRANVSWSKVAGAKGYYVYRKLGSGSYKRIATIKSGSTLKYVDKTVLKGKKYTYIIKAYNGSCSSANSAARQWAH